MKRILTFFILILTASVTVSIAPPALNQVWNTYVNDTVTPHFVIQYVGSDTTDAEEMLLFCKDALDWVNVQYPHDTASYWNSLRGTTGYPARVVVYLFDRADWYANGHTESQCYANPDAGTLSFMTRSQVDQQETWVKDVRWYKKNVAHEYVHIPTLRDLKASGQNYECPYWFSEGIAEGISIFFTTNEIRDYYLIDGRYEDRMEEAIQKVPLLFNQPGGYTLGAYVAKYMYESYGIGMVQDMFKNLQSVGTFWDAVETYLGMTKFAFELYWNRYASDMFNVGDRWRFNEVDTNRDGVINILDITRVATYFGDTLPDP